jgi:hypothetical protein
MSTFPRLYVPPADGDDPGPDAADPPPPPPPQSGRAVQLTLFDPGIPYEIRTPRRGEGYHAQLWARSGFWSCGVHPTREAARRAARAFSFEEPAPPPPGTPGPANWVRRRRRYDDDAPKWVRRVKGGAYQSRYWLEVVVGSLNLGLFTLAEHPDEPGDPQGEMARWAAARAARAFQFLWTGRRTVREAVEILQLLRPLPEDWPRHKWKVRGPWVPESVRVPEKWANLTLTSEYGDQEFAHERRDRQRRDRERRLYRLGTLLSVVDPALDWVLLAA